MQGTLGAPGAVVLVLAFLGSLAGCSPSDEPGEDGTVGTEAAAAEFDTLPDGSYFGFVIQFDGEAIDLDRAEMRSDKDAPNGFVVDNPDPSHLRLRAAPDLTVALLDNTALTPHEIDAATFIAFLDGQSLDWAYASPEHFAANVTLEDGEVVRIEEAYIP